MKIKKIIALSISVLLTLSLIGCSSPKDIFSFVLSGKNNKTSDGLEISETLNKDAVFKEIDEISLTDSNYVSSLIYSNGKFYATTYSYEYTDESEEDESESKTIININVTSFTSSSDLNTVTIKSEVQNKYYSDDFMGVDNSGNLYFVSNVTSDEDDSNTFYFEKFDSQGNLIETSEIPMNGSDDWVGKVCLDHEGNLFVTKAHSIDIFSSDFSAIGQYKIPDENVSITDMVVGNSGKLILVTSKWENDAPVYSAYNIDKSGTATPLSCSDLLGNRTLFNSVGYEYIYRINSSVYAFDDGDTSAKEIVNFYDSDVNPNGIGALKQAIDRFLEGKKILCVLGMLADKDIDSALRLLDGVFEAIYTVPIDNPRALAPDLLAEKCRSHAAEVRAFDSAELAFDTAFERAERENAAVLVCGSLYLAGSIRPYILTHVK